MAALLAIVSLVLGAPPAKAVLVDDWVSGDLIIGFRASDSLGQGFSSSYLVNIGQAIQYTSATSSFNLSIGDIGADLAATYGSSWFSRTDLTWSVVGTTTGAAPSLYASRARAAVGTQSTPWPGESSAAVRTGTKNQITSVTTAFNGLDATANSTKGAIQTNISGAASYNWQVTANSGTDFGSQSQWTNIEGAFGASSSKALDLYKIASATPEFRGVFSIDSGGQVAFNAVPEPSTYMLLAITGTVFMVFIRRRNVKQTA
ncbi:MAG: PEP-CTERM sorting domain-containing protein [Terrimicrobiaceae bacterium]